MAIEINVRPHFNEKQIVHTIIGAIGSIGVKLITVARFADPTFSRALVPVGYCFWLVIALQRMEKQKVQTHCQNP